MKSRWLQAGIAILVCGALIGIFASIQIVRNEGWEGLWNRKKQFIEKTHPELAPAVDEAEKAIRN